MGLVTGAIGITRAVRGRAKVACVGYFSVFAYRERETVVSSSWLWREIRESGVSSAMLS